MEASSLISFATVLMDWDYSAGVMNFCRLGWGVWWGGGVWCMYGRGSAVRECGVCGIKVPVLMF